MEASSQKHSMVGSIRHDQFWPGIRRRLKQSGTMVERTPRFRPQFPADREALTARVRLGLTQRIPCLFAQRQHRQPRRETEQTASMRPSVSGDLWKRELSRLGDLARPAI